MGRWDACSDYKRQILLTGNATDSLFSLSVRTSKKSLIHFICYLFQQLKKNLLKQ